MKKDNASFIAILGDKKLDRIMHAVDLFEDFKRMGQIIEVDMEGKDITFEKMAEFFPRLVKVYQKEYELSFLHLISIKRNGKIFMNNHKVKPYINPKTKIISSGEKFFLLKDFIKNLQIN